MEGKKIVDTPAKGTKIFLPEYHSLYKECSEDFSEVVYPCFWPRRQ